MSDVAGAYLGHATIMGMARPQKLQIEGRLQVIETTGAWSVYVGERIVIGSGESFRDDLGVKIREMFEEGATEALRDGRSPSERFELPSVRVTIELVEPDPARDTSSVSSAGPRGGVDETNPLPGPETAA
jgi:hypothetical protein